MGVKARKMKNLFIICLLFVFCSCSSDVENLENEDITTTENVGKTEWRCGTHNGHKLFTGPRGGCYYYNSKRNKIYVDRKECNC